MGFYLNKILDTYRLFAKMPKYFCDYCDTYLTHDSPSVRKTHCGGKKHKDNVRMYYQNWLEEQAQEAIDERMKAVLKQGTQKLPSYGGMPMMPPGGAPVRPFSGMQMMGGPMMRPMFMQPAMLPVGAPGQPMRMQMPPAGGMQRPPTMQMPMIMQRAPMMGVPR